MLWRTINRLLPLNRAGDRVSTYLWFVRVHRRLPDTARATFHDQLYAVKTTAEILDPLRVFTSDKELLKLFVGARLGEHYNIVTHSVLHSPAALHGFDFPYRCVIKPTHLSGPVILRRGGEPVDLAIVESWFNDDHYYWTREANYRYLRPKVIVEEFVFDADNPSDFKIFCVNGRPGFIQVDSDRHIGHTRSFYDCAWNKLPFAMTFPLTQHPVARPENLEEMLAVAATLSEHMGLVRVDLYSDGQRVKVGEMTHVHGNLRETFDPLHAEEIASRLLFEPAARST